MDGWPIDNSFVESNCQHNTKEENKHIRSGKVPEGWGKTPNKKPQKDTNAR